MSAKRFRIAFSFAGEKRDFVAKVAAILAQCFTEAAILYDKYHKAEFSRSDLAKLALREGRASVFEISRAELGVDLHRAPGVGQGFGLFPLLPQGFCEVVAVEGERGARRSGGRRARSAQYCQFSLRLPDPVEGTV